MTQHSSRPSKRGRSKILTPPFYIVSDTHFFHRNIVRYCGRPQNHERLMVENWQKVVGNDDVVLHMGDVFFSGRNGYERYKHNIMPRLPGKNYLILGNHDKKNIDWAALGFTVIKPFHIRYRNFDVSFDHYPMDRGEIRKGEHHIHVHGHIHTNGYGHSSRPKVNYRYGNVNVSIEEMGYTPVPVTEVLDKAIKNHNPKESYVNGTGKCGVAA